MPTKITHEILRTPECVECFENINTHANYVFGMFEVKSNEAMEKHEEAFTKHLKQSGEKADQFYSSQEDKFKEVIKEAIKDMTSTIKWFLGIILVIVMAVVGLTIGNTVSIATKANANEVLSLDDAKNIIMLGDKYRDQRYQLNKIESVDKLNYQWMLETIFERNSRGIKTKTIPLTKNEGKN